MNTAALTKEERVAFIKKNAAIIALERDFLTKYEAAKEAYRALIATRDGVIIDLPPTLVGRFAVCICANEVPSDRSLPFFKYCGYGSKQASIRCIRCGYFRGAHELDGSCRNYTGGKPLAKDSWYCGCQGGYE